MLEQPLGTHVVAAPSGSAKEDFVRARSASRYLARLDVQFVSVSLSVCARFPSRYGLLRRDSLERHSVRSVNSVHSVAK